MQRGGINQFLNILNWRFWPSIKKS